MLSTHLGPFVWSIQGVKTGSSGPKELVPGPQSAFVKAQNRPGQTGLKFLI